MNINEYLIIDAFHNKTIDSICFFLYVKKRFYHSIIYNFTFKSAAQKLNLPIPTVKRHVKVLAELGLVKMTNKHLHFISLKKAKVLLGYNHKHLCTIKFDKTYKLKNIKALLLSKIIEMQSRRVDFCIKGKTAIRLTLKHPKKLEKLRRKLENTGIERPENTITYSFIAKELNVSKTNAYYLVNQGRMLNLFTTQTITKNIGLFDRMSFDTIKDIGLGYFYFHNGNIYSILGTEYQSTTYPIQHKGKVKDCSKKDVGDYLSWKEPQPQVSRYIK
jgi:hypothetical protein